MKYEENLESLKTTKKKNRFLPYEMMRSKAHNLHARCFLMSRTRLRAQNSKIKSVLHDFVHFTKLDFDLHDFMGIFGTKPKLPHAR